MLTPEEQELIERYKHPLFSDKLDAPTHTASGLNASCGDEITMEAMVEDGTISHIRHHTQGCAICSASADFLAGYLEGKPISDLEAFSSEEALKLLPLNISPARLKCALLALNTAKNLKKGSD